MLKWFISFLILIASYSVCLAEVTTYYEPALGKVIVNSLFVEDRKPNEFPPETITFFKIKGTAQCFLYMTHCTSRGNIVQMPMGNNRLIINGLSINLKPTGQDYFEDLKAGDGFVGMRIKFAISEEIQEKILKAKSVKLIQNPGEEILFEASPLTLKEWKEVIISK